MTQSFVAVLRDSNSDLPAMQSTLDTLSNLGVSGEAKIASAHLAAQILEGADNSLFERLTKDRAAMAQQVIAKDAEIQTKLKTAA